MSDKDPYLDEQWYERTVRARRIAAGCCGMCGTRLIKPYRRPSRCPVCHVDERPTPYIADYRVYQDGEVDFGD